MRKLLLVSLLLANTANAATFSCDTTSLSRLNDDGSYSLLQKGKILNNLNVTVTNDVITFKAGGEVLEFWKDYKEYRNDTGRLTVTGDTYSVQTTIPVEDGRMPVKVDFNCK